MTASDTGQAELGLLRAAFADYTALLQEEFHETARARLVDLNTQLQSRGVHGAAALALLQRHAGAIDVPSMTTDVFSAFYRFSYFVCREQGKRNVLALTAVGAWRLVLAGRFRLLEPWCNFISGHTRTTVVLEDTWRQVLDFARTVHEDLSNYDPASAWPVLLDDFVEHLRSVRQQPSRPHGSSPRTIRAGSRAAAAPVTTSGGSEQPPPPLDVLLFSPWVRPMTPLAPRSGSKRRPPPDVLEVADQLQHLPLCSDQLQHLPLCSDQLQHLPLCSETAAAAQGGGCSSPAPDARIPLNSRGSISSNSSHSSKSPGGTATEQQHQQQRLLLVTKRLRLAMSSRGGGGGGGSSSPGSSSPCRVAGPNKSSGSGSCYVGHSHSLQLPQSPPAQLRGQTGSVTTRAPLRPPTAAAAAVPAALRPPLQSQSQSQSPPLPLLLQRLQQPGQQSSASIPAWGGGGGGGGSRGVFGMLAGCAGAGVYDDAPMDGGEKSPQGAAGAPLLLQPLLGAPGTVAAATGCRSPGPSTLAYSRDHGGLSSVHDASNSSNLCRGLSTQQQQQQQWKQQWIMDSDMEGGSPQLLQQQQQSQAFHLLLPTQVEQYGTPNCAPQAQLCGGGFDTEALRRTRSVHALVAHTVTEALGLR